MGNQAFELEMTGTRSMASVTADVKSDPGTETLDFGPISNRSGLRWLGSEPCTNEVGASQSFLLSTSSP